MSPTYHPRAYLAGMRNVNRGLTSRTKIIAALEQGRIRIIDISEKSKLSKSCVSHHLRLLLNHKVVTMAHVGRSARWTLTGYRQERLFT